MDPEEGPEHIPGRGGDGMRCTNIPVSQNEGGDGYVVMEYIQFGEECSSAHNCHAEALCDNATGTFTCTCDFGWQGDGALCENSNECEENLHDCDASATCKDTEGSFECSCPTGWSVEWKSSGWWCEDIDECMARTHSCDIPPPATMERGWTHWYRFRHEDMLFDWAGENRIFGLVDANHYLTENPQECPGGGCMHFDAQQVYNPMLIPLKNFQPNEGVTISFHVKLPGYIGADVTAQVLCATENDMCIAFHKSKLYLHPFGSFRPAVQDLVPRLNAWAHLVLVMSSEGHATLFYGGAGGRSSDSSIKIEWDATRFTDPNQFLLGSPMWGDLADIRIFDRAIPDEDIWSLTTLKSEIACENTNGSFACACAPGYTGDGEVCLDQDECSTSTDNCDADANREGDACFNTIGSFTCSCPIGYRGDGIVCDDIDECTLGDDSCHGFATCFNNIGSFTCACDAPWSGDGVSCVSNQAGVKTISLNAAADGSVADFMRFQSEHGFENTDFKSDELRSHHRLDDHDRVVLMQFDSIPRGVTEAKLELSKHWDASACVSSRYVLEAVHGDILTGAVRRWEPFDPPVSATVQVTRKHGRNTLDVGALVRAAAAKSSRLAFHLSSDEHSCMSAFRSSRFRNPPLLHVAHDGGQTQERVALSSTSLIEPSLDVYLDPAAALFTVHTSDPALVVMKGVAKALVSLLRFDNVPQAAAEHGSVRLVVTRQAAPSQFCEAGSIRVRTLALEPSSSHDMTQVVAQWSTLQSDGGEMVHGLPPSPRQSFIDLTDLVRAALPTGGSLLLELSTVDEGCAAVFTSSRANSHALTTVRLSDRPFLEITHDYACGGCTFHLGTAGELQRDGECSEDQETCTQQLGLSNHGIQSLNPTVFAGMGKLKVLDLSRNAIVNLFGEAFSSLGELVQLDLSFNLIERFNPNTFGRLRKLQKLWLDLNRVADLRTGMFRGLRNVIALSLSNNNVRKINFDAFDGLDSIEWLDLKSNQLSHIDLVFSNPLQTLEALGLTDNPMQCLPLVPNTILFLDFDWWVGYSRPWCTPFQCPATLGDKPAAVWRGVEMAMNLIRPDAQKTMDAVHLREKLYVTHGANRCWCSYPFTCFSLHSSVSVCKPGQFHNGDECAPCPAGTFNDGTNAACFPCEDGKVSEAGASKCISQSRFAYNDLADSPKSPCLTWLDTRTGTCVEIGQVSCDKLKAGDESQAFTEFGGCSDSDCACSEEESNICHMHAYCSGFSFAVAVPDVPGIVAAGVSHPSTSDGLYACSCPREMLGHGYGTNGCETKGWVVRVVYKATACLSAAEESALLELLGGLTCRAGATTTCDHVHYTHHGSDLGANVLFRHTAEGKAAAEAAATAFNDIAASTLLLRRRTAAFPPAVDPRLGARVYAWTAGTTSSPLSLLPSGLEVRGVHFEAGCADTGCWVLDVVYTTASSDVRLDSFNTLFFPYAVGSDALSYDYDYDDAILDTFQPANFPCSVSNYVAVDGTVTSLPVEATGCCFGTAFDTQVLSKGKGMLGNYRVTESFAAYASSAYAVLCPGGYDEPQITASGSTPTLKPEEKFPSSTEAQSFIAEGGKFMGMPSSPGITRVAAMDAFVGQYEATIKVDEKELRTRAGLLKGTVGVEHTVDFFLGFANFKAATSSYILDSMATQTAIHVEKTSFFSVSTHGINDYSFLQYVNLRLIAVYKEDKDFSGVDESANRTVRTDPSGAANYVQVTFTLGSKYDVNSNSGLIPLDSVRAGRGTFLNTVENAGGLHHKCLEYVTSPANEFDSLATISRFNATVNQGCGPAAVMCSSPESIPDSFVSFNIPLGTEFFGEPSQTLDNNVFVDLVISAVDNDTRTGSGSQNDITSPNDGEAPWQMKTTLSASIPVVAGGINIFCDGITAKTDLTDVANVDIIVGSAASFAELSRLRIVSDVASSQLDVQGEVVIDSDSIEAGLMTLVLKGDAAYFEDNAGINTRGVSLELEDVITIHLMESDGTTADGSGSEGKQAAVKALLAESADDNTDAAEGLDTDGYALNGAFLFNVDRSAQRAHLQPSLRLQAICPFNPPRPQATGSVVMETCVTRRDVQYRDFPWRVGAVSTAMEISASAYETRLETTSVESGFFTSIFGDSLYAKQLAVDFASAIDEKYSLNGRSRRAFWVNPGYEWSPTQTGGASLFQLSQKLFLFALVTLDERIASSPGKSIFDAAPFAGAPQDLNSDGASEAVSNQPKVPSARRRMLLTVDPTAGDKSTLSSAQLSFGVTRLSLMASAYGVSPEHVATFAVELQLLPEQECLGREELQQEIQSFLEPYVKQAASATDAVQVLSFSTPPTFGTGCGQRRVVGTSSTANVNMLVIFSETTKPVFDLAAFSVLPRINAINPVVVSDTIQVQGSAIRRPVSLSQADSPKDSDSLNIGLVAGACSGALVFCLAGAILYKRYQPTRNSALVQATATMNFDNIKLGGPANAALLFQPLEESVSGSVPGSPLAASRMNSSSLSRNGSTHLGLGSPFACDTRDLLDGQRPSRTSQVSDAII